jgi:hypothetical protein
MPGEDAVLLLLYGLLRSGHIVLHRIDWTPGNAVAENAIESGVRGSSENLINAESLMR